MGTGTVIRMCYYVCISEDTPETMSRHVHKSSVICMCALDVPKHPGTRYDSHHAPWVIIGISWVCHVDLILTMLRWHGCTIWEYTRIIFTILNDCTTWAWGPCLIHSVSSMVLTILYEYNMRVLHGHVSNMLFIILHEYSMVVLHGHASNMVLTILHEYSMVVLHGHVSNMVFTILH